MADPRVLLARLRPAVDKARVCYELCPADRRDVTQVQMKVREGCAWRRSWKRRVANANVKRRGGDDPPHRGWGGRRSSGREWAPKGSGCRSNDDCMTPRGLYAAEYTRTTPAKSYTQREAPLPRNLTSRRAT